MNPLRIMTVDWEDWFHSTNVRDHLNPDDWNRLPSQLPANTEWLLNLLQARGLRVTFFVLGWVAEKYPQWVRRIAEGGHEIACHGYDHTPLFQTTPDQLRAALERSVAAIENACGARPRGYRAPAFSLQPQTFWALDILRQMDFQYDSSMVSIVRHPNYGIRGFPRKPFWFKGLVEIPVPEAWGFPVGGAYFRLFPYWFTRAQLARQEYSVFYVHPWELTQPPVPDRLPLSKRFRHTVGWSTTRAKLLALLRDFSFASIADFLRSDPRLPACSGAD